MAYSLEDAGEDVRRLTHKVDALVEHEMTEDKKEFDMDMGALLGLLNANKGMDLPGLLALTKDQGFGGNGMWLLIILLFFMNGNGGLFGNNRALAADAVGGMQNLEIITSLYDRLNNIQSSTQQSFTSLMTDLCSGFANTIGAVNTQGDRLYDATRNVGDAVRSCCCAMEAKLATIQCELGCINRSINELNVDFNNRIALSEERNANGQEKILNAIALSQQNIICKIDSTATAQQLADANRRANTAEEALREQRILAAIAGNTPVAG